MRRVSLCNDGNRLSLEKAHGAGDFFWLAKVHPRAVRSTTSSASSSTTRPSVVALTETAHKDWDFAMALFTTEAGDLLC